ncbi:MAG TPA: adenylate/guanylate cyclase domain-containing protein, partial [Solirubrobacteraceae bacterium]
ISQVEHYWEEPVVARYFERLASFSRLIMFDRRGTGLSDPVIGAPTLEEQMDDVVAVMDAVGSERAALFAMLEAGAMASLFAATHPERTSALLLYEAIPRTTATPGYDWPPTREEREASIETLMADWGSGARVLALTGEGGPRERLLEWAGRLERLAASPATAAALQRMHSETDVRPVLPSIQAPTLVLHRPHDKFVDIRHSRYVADAVPKARLVELPGRHTLPFASGQDALIAEIQEFLTGARQPPDPERVLATVMFSDIVESTRIAAEVGDRRWREVVESFDQAVSGELARHRGRSVKSLGDGFLATFDGPARAIRCAVALRNAARGRGLELRIGVHTGEVELMGADVGGMAVHISARVVALAEPGEVLVSGTVKDLVVGSRIGFMERGERELKGVPGLWRLWAVDE